VPDDLVNFVPADVSAAVAWLFAGGALIGAALWLVGARLGRSLLTLLMVGAGAAVGLRLPTWLGLPISAWTSAIALALFLGIVAFALHRLWTAVGLGILLAIWAGAVAARLYPPDAGFSLRQLLEAGSLAETLWRAWSAMPVELRRVGLFAIAAAIACGISMGLIWPRLTGYVFWSLVGVSAMIVCGRAALESISPELLAYLPRRLTSQCLSVGGIVLFGALVQWQTAPRPTPARAHAQTRTTNAAQAACG